MEIIEAVNTLRDEIQAGQPVVDSVSWVVEEYGFKEEVLRARFERAFDKTPEQMAEVKIVARDLTAEAIEEAHRRAKNFVLPDWQKPLVGKPFWYENMKFIFIAYGSGTYGLKAVKVDTGHEFGFNIPAGEKILAQLEK